jgi:hypothetical protein
MQSALLCQIDEKVLLVVILSAEMRNWLFMYS